MCYSDSMKIIGVDNFARESVSDILVCSEISEYYGQKIVDMLNLDSGQNSLYYYLLVPDDHKLYAFEP